MEDFSRTLNEDIYIDFKEKSTDFKLRQPALGKIHKICALRKQAKKIGLCDFPCYHR